MLPSARGRAGSIRLAARAENHFCSMTLCLGHPAVLRLASQFLTALPKPELEIPHPAGGGTSKVSKLGCYIFVPVPPMVQCSLPLKSNSSPQCL